MTTENTPNTQTENVPAQRPRDNWVAEVDNRKRSLYSTEEMQSLATFDEAIALATEKYGPTVDASEVLGDGFTLLHREDKKRLVGVPMLLMEWSVNQGDFGPFVAVRIASRNPDGKASRYILVDGSTGIADSLIDYHVKTGRNGNVLVKRGLRESTYDFCENCGHARMPKQCESDGHTLRPATTFYLDLSA